MRGLGTRTVARSAIAGRAHHKRSGCAGFSQARVADEYLALGIRIRLVRDKIAGDRRKRDEFSRLADGRSRVFHGEAKISRLAIGQAAADTVICLRAIERIVHQNRQSRRIRRIDGKRQRVRCTASGPGVHHLNQIHSARGQVGGIQCCVTLVAACRRSSFAPPH